MDRQSTAQHEADQLFTQALEQAARGLYRIHSKVPVTALIKPTIAQGKSAAWREVFETIRSRHFDFVLCKLGRTAVACVIELYDSPRQSDGVRKERDENLEKICASLKLPVLFVTRQQDYNVEELRNALILKTGQVQVTQKRDAAGHREKPVFTMKLELEDDGEDFMPPPAPGIDWRRWLKPALTLLALVAVLGLGGVLVSKYGERAVSGLKGAAVSVQDSLSKSQSKAEKPVDPAKTDTKSSSAGEVQCWKDAQGNIIYSNAIPSGKGVKPCRQ